jgi:hypothetical protein
MDVNKQLAHAYTSNQLSYPRWLENHELLGLSPLQTKLQQADPQDTKIIWVLAACL